MRALVLVVVVGALIALLWARPSPAPATAVPRLTYVTTARQLGVVGYRDPVGVISHDGSTLAYTEGRHVRVMPIGGGAPLTLAAGDGQSRYLTWIDDHRLAGEDTGAANRWWSTTWLPRSAPALERQRHQQRRRGRPAGSRERPASTGLEQCRSVGSCDRSPSPLRMEPDVEGKS